MQGAYRKNLLPIQWQSKRKFNVKTVTVGFGDFQTGMALQIGSKINILN